MKMAMVMAMSSFPSTSPSSPDITRPLTKTCKFVGTVFNQSSGVVVDEADQTKHANLWHLGSTTNNTHTYIHTNTEAYTPNTQVDNFDVFDRSLYVVGWLGG